MILYLYFWDSFPQTWSGSLTLNPESHHHGLCDPYIILNVEDGQSGCWRVVESVLDILADCRADLYTVSEGYPLTESRGPMLEILYYIGLLVLKGN